MTTYSLAFLPSAQREWRKLGSTVQKQFVKKLRERLVEPRVEAARLHALPDCYKIKLRDAGYRLVYRVCDDVLIVQVIAVGKRDKDRVYTDAGKRL